jgi:nicotinamidase-related amidase
MEAHVCVLQTALDAVAQGYSVFVAGDAISSRSASDVEAAKQRMVQSGVTMISAEMAFFEWLERSGTPEFKTLSPLLR